MNSIDIFSIALGLESPWYVRDVKFEPSLANGSKELHIWIDFTKGSSFKLEDDSSSKAYDTENKTWQHLNFFEHKCYLHARVPRVRTIDGKIRQTSVPWARPGSGFTLLYEAYCMLLIECEMPISKVAHCMRVTAPRIWRVFDYWIDRAVRSDDLSSVCEIGIDETSSKKGHDYVTLFVDMQSHRVIDVEKGKHKETVSEFVYAFEAKGGHRRQIEQVSMDMSPAFISGVLSMLPNAQVTFDKFHLIQNLNQAMDTVRKAERIGNEALKNHKYTFLKNTDRLSKSKQGDLNHLLMLYPILGEAYRLKEMFKDVFYISDPEEAKGYMKFWCDLAVESKIMPFVKFVNMIKAHWFGVVNYFDSKITNGVLEGINSKVQLIKRRARGYRKIDNFINMIHFCCGKLKFDYPHYSL